MIRSSHRLGSFMLCGLLLSTAVEQAIGQETSLFHQPPPQASETFPQQPGSSSLSTAGQSPYAPSGVAATQYYRGNPDTAQNLAAASWTYQPAPPMRVFNQHDIITIRVDELGRLLAEGNSQKRRSGQYLAALTDWIQLSDGKLGPSSQQDGDPAIGYKNTDSARNQATLETKESLTFNIAATIVDIRPNGNLVLEARKSIRSSDNIWETSLSGTCRAIDVGPDNVVLSKDLLNLAIQKEDQGALRDSYKRGWFTRWFDRLQPF